MVQIRTDNKVIELMSDNALDLAQIPRKSSKMFVRVNGNLGYGKDYVRQILALHICCPQ
jgi:hypothetical protein